MVFVFVPKPTILPPTDVVVLNQASMLKLFGPRTGLPVVDAVAVVPSNEVAASESPERAPRSPG